MMTQQILSQASSPTVTSVAGMHRPGKSPWSSTPSRPTSSTLAPPWREVLLYANAR